MAIYIKQADGYLKFYTDDTARFVMAAPDTKESVILHEMSDEYDGICDDDGSLHFLIQSMQGELLYVRYENGTWKKYNIFKNKDNLRKISNIHLTYSGGLLCAFYTMEHSDKIMLVKHMFSASKLYVTPEIADLADTKKDFCVCTHPNGNTHLFYRDSAGRRQETVYDKYFVRGEQNIKAPKGEVYNMCVVNSGDKIYGAYISVKKNYTALMFSKCGAWEQEKIITFGIPKNTKIAISAKDDDIVVCWYESGTIMQSASKNGGESFSKPYAVGRGTEVKKIRSKGQRAGMYRSYYAAPREPWEREKVKQTDVHERMRNVNSTAGYNHETKDNFVDMKSQEFTYKLGQIKAEVDKIGRDMDKICMFLQRLTEFKENAAKDVFTPQTVAPDSVKGLSDGNVDIGEKNEENIRLFESMDIDDVLPESGDGEIISSEGDVNE